MYQVKVQTSYDSRRADQQRTLGIRTNQNNNDDLADIVQPDEKHFSRREKEKYPPGKFIPKRELGKINDTSDDK